MHSNEIIKYNSLVGANFLIISLKHPIHNLMITRAKQKNIAIVNGNSNEDTSHKSKQIVSRKTNSRLGDRIVLKQEARTG